MLCAALLGNLVAGHNSSSTTIHLFLIDAGVVCFIVALSDEAVNVLVLID